MHKLGIPIIVPANETFDIHRIHFANRIVDGKEIEGIILQISQKHCDNLFFLEAENYFSSNRQYAAIREVEKICNQRFIKKSL